MTDCDCLKPGTVVSIIRDAAEECDLLWWFESVHERMHAEGWPTQSRTLWDAALRGARTNITNQKARERMAGL